MVKVIGIAGGSASGKTTILHILKDELGDNALILSLDSYYLPYAEFTLEERKQLNFDHPKAFDIPKLIEDLKALRQGHAIDMPVYDYVQYTRSDEVVRVEPKPVILFEGLFTLYYPELEPYIDMRVYVQADADVRLIRRILRDQKERGRSLDSILDQYITSVKPMHEAFIAPSKKNADVIIPRGAENEKGISLLKAHLREMFRDASEVHADPGMKSASKPKDAEGTINQ